MKKIALLSAALIVLASSSAFAVGVVGTGIKGSAHDLQGDYGTYGNQGSDQICVYCHTPHNSVKNVPLWNRSNPSGSPFELYNSVTLSTAAKGSSLTSENISTFCLSCHDGVTKLGAFVNDPLKATDTQRAGADNKNTIANFAGVPVNNGTGYAALATDGQSLKNDHPIGFSYSDAVTQVAAGAGSNGVRLHTASEVMTTYGGNVQNGQAFYGANQSMECASCHLVHNPGVSGNFLRIENDGSKLCLACHQL